MVIDISKREPISQLESNIQGFENWKQSCRYVPDPECRNYAPAKTFFYASAVYALAACALWAWIFFHVW